MKTQTKRHQAEPFASMCLRFLNGCLRPYLTTCSQDLPTLSKMKLLQFVKNNSVCADPTKRRTFTTDEIENMMKVVKDPSEDVLLTILTEIALRHGALANLKYIHLLDDNLMPRLECKVLEKGNIYRAFVPSNNLRIKIKRLAEFFRNHHIDENIMNCYVFNFANPSKPSKTIWETVHRIARDAGVTDVNVHPHAFRHTLVSRLVSAGNSMDIISKFIGHSDVKTTSFFYWIPTATDLEKDLINPFAEDFNEKKKLMPITSFIEPSCIQLANAKVAACRRIIEIMSKHCCMTDVNADCPELQEILQEIDSPLGLTSEAQSNDFGSNTLEKLDAYVLDVKEETNQDISDDGF